MKAVIHVNQHVIKSNRKNGASDPAITVKVRGRSTYAREVELTGPSRVVYRPESPLKCGAHCWIEVDHSHIKVVE